MGASVEVTECFAGAYSGHVFAEAPEAAFSGD
jgi:hypothetical protein